jgi:Cof subfamily protein (haloacid dehalogenase superfamily)
VAKARPPGPFRLLALDVDGTLLDPDGTLRPATRAAVARAAAAGLRPVLCTGRRYRRARPIAEQLGLDAPLVCNSGALVKDPDGDRTLWRADLGPDLLRGVLGLLRGRGLEVVSFTDDAADRPDFLVTAYPTGCPLFDEYVRRNREHAAIDPEWARRPDGPHFHLCTIGDRPGMLAVEADLHAHLGPHVRTFVQKSPRYAGTMCEVLHAEASKWSAVSHLAALWGIPPEAICAVGDDVNDAPMIAGAGFGVAMAHAPESVRAVADHVADDADHDGVARLIDEVLLA